MSNSELAAAAATRLLAFRRAATNFQDYITIRHPEWKDIPPFHEEIQEIINAFERDEYTHRFILVTMPPRHSKSTYFTEEFPAYFLGRDPRRHVMTTSFNSDLAMGFGRKVRNIFQDETTFGRIFPEAQIAKDSRRKDVWNTTQDGSYFGIGLDGTTTGRPANLLIVDDPLKSRKDADSALMRNRVWDFWVSSLRTRLQPELDGTPPRVVVVLTRWHVDDIAGRLMETEDWQNGLWKHINYQALTTKKVKILGADLPKDDPDYAKPPSPDAKKLFVREEHSALWPRQKPVAELLKEQREDPHDFESLYQQRPFLRGGSEVKTEWWRVIPAQSFPTRYTAIVSGIDTAYTIKTRSDFSVILTAGLDDEGNAYILDVERVKALYADLKRRTIQTHHRWAKHGLRAIYVEERGAGETMCQELRSEMGLNMLTSPTGRADKLERVQTITSDIEEGRVYLPQEAPWLDAYLSEWESFPQGKNDDQVDATVIALAPLFRMHVPKDAYDISKSLNQTGGKLPPSSGSGPSLHEVFQRHHADPEHPDNQIPGQSTPPITPTDEAEETPAETPYAPTYLPKLAPADVDIDNYMKSKKSTWRGWGV